MAVSRSSGRGRNRLSPYGFSAMFSRYDLLLAAIPLVLAVGLFAGIVVPVPLHYTIGSGALMCSLFLADALYFNPPTDASGGS